MCNVIEISKYQKYTNKDLPSESIKKWLPTLDEYMRNRFWQKSWILKVINTTNEHISNWLK